MICACVATKECATIPTPPTIIVDEGDIMNGMRLGAKVVNTNKSQIVAQGVATVCENDIQPDTLTLDPRLEQDMLIVLGQANGTS